MALMFKNKALPALVACLVIGPVAMAMDHGKGGATPTPAAAAKDGVAPAQAAARAKRPFGTVAKAPWIASIDQMAGFPRGTVHVIGEFGNDPSRLVVRDAGRLVPFQMANSSLLLVKLAHPTASTQVEVQLGTATHSAGFHRGGFEPIADVQVLFQSPSEGPMGAYIAYWEERDLRPDGKGGLECWGSRGENYRVIDYNKMIAKAFETAPADSKLVAGGYHPAQAPVKAAAAAGSKPAFAADSAAAEAVSPPSPAVDAVMAAGAEAFNQWMQGTDDH